MPYKPYAKGRWYKEFVESTGEAYKLTTSDIEDATITGNFIKMPEGFHVIDVKYDINSVEAAAAANNDLTLKIYADGKQAVILPPIANFDYADVYIFGYFA